VTWRWVGGRGVGGGGGAGAWLHILFTPDNTFMSYGVTGFSFLKTIIILLLFLLLLLYFY